MEENKRGSAEMLYSKHVIRKCNSYGKFSMHIAQVHLNTNEEKMLSECSPKIGLCFLKINYRDAIKMQ